MIAFASTTGIVWLMMQSVGELATSYPVPSAFSTWSSQFVDKALGFAAGNLSIEKADDRVELLVLVDRCYISRIDRSKYRNIILDRLRSCCSMDFNLSPCAAFLQSIRSSRVWRNRDDVHNCQIRFHGRDYCSLCDYQWRQSSKRGENWVYIALPNIS